MVIRFVAKIASGALEAAGSYNYLCFYFQHFSWVTNYVPRKLFSCFAIVFSWATKNYLKFSGPMTFWETTKTSFWCSLYIKHLVWKVFQFLLGFISSTALMSTVPKWSRPPTQYEIVIFFRNSKTLIKLKCLQEASWNLNNLY